MKTLAMFVPAIALAASAAVAQPAQTPAPAAPAATAAQPSAAFQQRAAEVLRLLNGEGDPTQIFTPAFLQQVPVDRMRAMSEQIRGQAGRAVAIEQVQAANANEGTFVVRFERVSLNAQMALEPAAPNQIRGLMLRPAN